MHTQQDIIDKIIPILKQYPIKKAALFGSYAKNEQTEASDIDIIVSMPKLDALLFSSLRVDIIDAVEKHCDLIYEGDFERMDSEFKESASRTMEVFYESNTE